MSEDILQEVEAMCIGVFSIKERPDLVSEIKRLRERESQLKSLAASHADTANAAFNDIRQMKEQLAARDVLIRTLECDKLGLEASSRAITDVIGCDWSQTQAIEAVRKMKARIAELEQVAIEERARGNWYFDKIEKCKLAYTPWSVKAQPGNGTQINDRFVRDFRARAAKELQLEAAKEAGYVERLEAAYLVAEKRLIAFHYRCKRGENMQEVIDRTAQAALDRIREGK
ncbi:MAG: hypothetical protein M0R80_03900 [Proteobacteria bacterium]|jgi:hypothetical protein|nr:hypothetical protein [Pseudomonadota bacterium]